MKSRSQRPPEERDWRNRRRKRPGEYRRHEKTVRFTEEEMRLLEDEMERTDESTWAGLIRSLIFRDETELAELPDELPL